MPPNLPNSFHGILPAVVTPVDDDGGFRPEAMERLLARLYETGVDGVYVCGQTGEGLQQPAAQRIRVAEVAARNSPKGKQVIVHVGAMSTREAVELARHASQTGACAVSSLPPIGGYSFIEIRDYYRDLAAASDVPLLVYYFPALAPALTQVDQLLELCGLPNVAGLKFTDDDLYKLWAIQTTGAAVFNGSDEILVAGLLRGACGGIGSTYNLIPDLYVRLFSLTRAGRWQEASALQDEINGLIAIILRYPVNPAVKTLLAWSGLDCGPCIAPRRRLTAVELEDLRARIAASPFATRFAAMPVPR